MSFGFSPSDILTLVALTHKAYDGWRSAGKRFRDITYTLSSFEILLRQINHRFDELDALEALQARREELERVLRGCKSAVVELRDVARKHKRLGNWDRLKFGLKDISSPKERLVRHMGLLTPFLLMTEMESIGRDMRSLPKSFDQIPNIVQGAVTVAFGKMLDARADDARSARSSILTTYGDDDRQAYKELRRNLRSLGIRDSDVRQHRLQLVTLVKSILRPEEGTAAEVDEKQAPAKIQGGDDLIHAPTTATQAPSSSRLATDSTIGRVPATSADIDSDQSDSSSQTDSDFCNDIYGCSNDRTLVEDSEVVETSQLDSCANYGDPANDRANIDSQLGPVIPLSPKPVALESRPAQSTLLSQQQQNLSGGEAEESSSDDESSSKPELQENTVSTHQYSDNYIEETADQAPKTGLQNNNVGHEPLQYFPPTRSSPTGGPNAKEPTVERPSTEGPTAGKPTAEGPTAEEPTTEELTAEESTAEAPRYESVSSAVYISTYQEDRVSYQEPEATGTAKVVDDLRVTDVTNRHLEQHVAEETSRAGSNPDDETNHLGDSDPETISDSGYETPYEQLPEEEPLHEMTSNTTDKTATVPETSIISKFGLGIDSSLELNTESEQKVEPSQNMCSRTIREHGTSQTIPRTDPVEVEQEANDECHSQAHARFSRTQRTVEEGRMDLHNAEFQVLHTPVPGANKEAQSQRLLADDELLADSQPTDSPAWSTAAEHGDTSSFCWGNQDMIGDVRNRREYVPGGTNWWHAYDSHHPTQARQLFVSSQDGQARHIALNDGFLQHVHGHIDPIADFHRHYLYPPSHSRSMNPFSPDYEPTPAPWIEAPLPYSAMRPSSHSASNGDVLRNYGFGGHHTEGVLQQAFGGAPGSVQNARLHGMGHGRFPLYAPTHRSHFTPLFYDSDGEEVANQTDQADGCDESTADNLRRMGVRPERAKL